MIPVVPAPEPERFDADVRQKGLSAIAELVGEPPLVRRQGPRIKKVAARREEIPTEKFPPYWRNVLPETRVAYGSICAYLSLYIEKATGSATVDHMIPKSKAWDRVYEWTNYRLACAIVNARKSDTELALDPFEIEPETFALEFVEFQVIPGPRAIGDLQGRVNRTINLLGLNLSDCRAARREYVVNYEEAQISLAYLERRAPFIAYELTRQSRLRPEDRR